MEVAACGLCGSDLHEYLHGPIYIPKQPHPLTGVMPPVTLGHEFSGRVVDVGARVSGVRTGDRVAVNPCLVCGECRWCRSGRPNHCAKLATIGLSRDGALAPLVAVPAYGCHVLPADVDDEQGAVVEPLAVAVHACRRARLCEGEHVAVIGAGPIGLLVLQVARARGAGSVTMVEPREERRRLAHELGADAVIDPATGDPARTIADFTDGARADVVFECVGSPAAFASAFRAAGKGGRVVLVGLVPEPVSANPSRSWPTRRRSSAARPTSTSSRKRSGSWRAARCAIESLVTGARAPGARPRRRARGAAPSGRGHVKILISPRGSAGSA